MKKLLSLIATIIVVIYFLIGLGLDQYQDYKASQNETFIEGLARENDRYSPFHILRIISWPLYLEKGSTVKENTIPDTGNNQDDLDKSRESLEKYDHPNRLACSINDSRGKEYDGTWDPKQVKYSGILKIGKNGVLWQSTTFKDGVKNGEALIYDENGLLMGITDWKQGKREGRYYQLDEKGRFMFKAKTKNDKIVACEGPLCHELIGLNQ
jgi:hypothetical protein